jgi:phenylalanyl-tRNA synthetase beta chain
VSRDLSLVVGPEISYEQIRVVLAEPAPPAPATFEVVDRYAGDPLPPGRSSLTIRVTLQPFDRTLTDPEIEGYRRELVGALEARLGLELRG